jgi:hypothetical protein
MGYEHRTPIRRPPSGRAPLGARATPPRGEKRGRNTALPFKNPRQKFFWPSAHRYGEDQFEAKNAADEPVKPIPQGPMEGRRDIRFGAQRG